jgi:hypothetical protein
MDLIKNEIYLSDTISDDAVDSFWTVSSGDFAKIMDNPEINADSGSEPNDEQRDKINYWILIIAQI